MIWVFVLLFVIALGIIVNAVRSKNEPSVDDFIAAWNETALHFGFLKDVDEEVARLKGKIAEFESGAVPCTEFYTYDRALKKIIDMGLLKKYYWDDTEITFEASNGLLFQVYKIEI